MVILYKLLIVLILTFHACRFWGLWCGLRCFGFVFGCALFVVYFAVVVIWVFVCYFCDCFGFCLGACIGWAGLLLLRCVWVLVFRFGVLLVVKYVVFVFVVSDLLVTVGCLWSMICIWILFVLVMLVVCC